MSKFALAFTFCWAALYEHRLLPLRKSNLSRDVKTRLVRAFRGKWKRYRHQVETVPLQNILPLVQYLLQNSYLTVEGVVFLQTKGASMGSPRAPILRLCGRNTRTTFVVNVFRIF